MKDSFYVGDWFVEPSLNRITRTGKKRIIEPRLMRLLLRLADQPGAVVSREELMNSAWGDDVIVTENSLNNSISELRKMLRNTPQMPPVIETIRSSGYRLVAPVQLTPLENTLDARSTPVRKPFSWALVLAALAAGTLGWVAFLGVTQHPPPASNESELIFQPFSTLPGPEYGPVFSADGNHVAFVRFDPDLGSADIYTKTIGHAEATQLTDLSGAAFYPAWSPDGLSIAFVWNRRDGCGIYLVSTINGEVSEILSTNYSTRHLDWSPDGQYLVYSYADDDSNEQYIARLHIESGTIDRLTSPSASESDWWPKYSPDQRYIAFRRSTTNHSEDVYYIEARGPRQPVERMTFDESPLYGYAWSQESDRIYLASIHDQQRGLWKIDVQSKEMRLVRSLGSREVNHLAVARQKNRAAFIQETSDINIYAAAIAADSIVDIRIQSPSTHMERYPQLSPDGAALLFVSDRSGYPEIWRLDRATGESLQLTNFQTPWTSRPRWSPDGQRIVFESRTEEYTDLFILSAKGGTPTRFSSSPANEVAPSWSKNGQYIYFGSDQTGAWEIWRKPLTGGKSEQVSQQGGYLALEPATEGLLYYTRPEPHNDIVRHDLASGSVVTITSPLTNQSYDTIEVSGESLYFLTPINLPGQFGLFRYRPTDQAPLQIGTLPLTPVSYFYEWGFSVSSDGTEVVFAQIDGAESDIVLVEQFGMRMNVHTP